MKQLLFTFLFVIFSLIAWAQEAIDKPVLKVRGEVGNPLSLSVSDLKVMRQVTAELNDRDGKVYHYTGVPVMDILLKAGVTMGPHLRGDNLTKYMLVKSADGYQVLFSLAELDSGFNDRPVVLAYKVEGNDLPLNKGPFRIIVPGEKRPARSSFQVIDLVVGFGKDE